MIDGKESSKVNHLAMHKIAAKPFIPLHKPGEWYRDKFGWKQQPYPAEEKKQKHFYKEMRNKRIERATYGITSVQKTHSVVHAAISSDKTPKNELKLLKKLHLTSG